MARDMVGTMFRSSLMAMNRLHCTVKIMLETLHPVENRSRASSLPAACSNQTSAQESTIHAAVSKTPEPQSMIRAAFDFHSTRLTMSRMATTQQIR